MAATARHSQPFKQTCQHHQCQQGLAMLEALTALALLSLGAWGIQISITAAKQQASQQLHRAQALALLDDLAQRIRIHQWRFGAASVQAHFGNQVLQAVPERPAPLCDNTPCAAPIFAQWVLTNWSYELSHRLPTARASTHIQGERLQLMVAWAQPGSGNFSWQGICPTGMHCEVLWL